MKRHERNSKYEPLVDGVELLEANPQYAHIRKPDGTETTISLKHLAPKGNDSNANQPHMKVKSVTLNHSNRLFHLLLSSLYSNLNLCISSPPVLHRSTRVSKPPSRYY